MIITRPPGPRIYFSPSSDKVLVFNPGGMFDGWVCQWRDGIGSGLSKLGQLREVPVPPDVDIERCLREGTPLRFAKSPDPSKPSR